VTTSPNVERRCSKCTFWRQGMRYKEKWITHEKDANGNVVPMQRGLCTLRAPGNCVNGVQPSMYADDWCFQFERYPGPHPGYQQSGSVVFG
jgi:hypothetical protein